MDTQTFSIPYDLIVQILARLPIKSLLKFRSVSKSWSALPSDPHFIRLHRQISSQNPNLLIELLSTYATSPTSTFISLSTSTSSLTFSLNFLNDRVKVRASSNGLLCCASITNKGVYYVCNPMTRESRLLPSARDRPLTRFQPEYEATLVGLAVDPSTYRYSVVLAGFYRPFGHRPHDQLVCLVFDSHTNSWSKFISHFFEEEFTHMNRNQVVFFNGALHWLTHSCSFLLVLDLRDWVWRKVSMPDEIVASGFSGRIYLLELGGLVSVVRMSGDWMCIWVLKDYLSEQWALEDRVHLGCIGGFATSAFPISQSRDVVFLVTQKKVLAYGRRNKVWREVYSGGDNCAYPLWFSAHPFTETLFSC